MLELLKIYGVSAGIAALINFLFKAWIDHQASRSVENLRAENARHLAVLRAEQTTALERQRAELTRGSYRHSRLHDLRLKAIEELMTTITQLNLALGKLVGIRSLTGDEKRDQEIWSEDFQSAVDSYNKFIELSLEKGWLLKDEASAKLETLRLAAVEGLSGIEYNKRSISFDAKGAIDEFRKAAEKVRVVIPATRKELEAEFLRLLSDE